MLRRAIDESFVDHQPAAALGQFVVPVEQARRLDQAAGRVVRVDHQQYIHLRQRAMHRALAQLDHPVPLASPGGSVLGIGRCEDTHAAVRAQTWQGLDRRLRAGYRQQADGAVIIARRLLQAVVRFRQARPGRARYRRQIPTIGCDPGGQIQPVLQRDAIALRRCAQTTSMFKHPAPPRRSGITATSQPRR